MPDKRLALLNTRCALRGYVNDVIIGVHRALIRPHDRDTLDALRLAGGQGFYEVPGLPRRGNAPDRSFLAGDPFCHFRFCFLLTNSPAMCCASAALPPFPAHIVLLPLR